jgi:cell division protein FtsB|tara:strand:+ start:230 stop:382 length:153 start_codon:yes stop_codon:yes gene_type:complete
MEQMRRTLLAKESDIDLLKKQIQEETKEKYSLYKRIVELNAEIEKLKNSL